MKSCNRVIVSVLVLFGLSSGCAVDTSATASPLGSPPPTVTVTQRSDGLAVSWTTIQAAASYSVLRGGSPLANVNAPTTSYIDAAVFAGSTYCYQVAGVFEDGSATPPSSQVCAVATLAPSCTIAVSRVAGLAVRLDITASCNGDGWSLDYRMISSAGGLSIANRRDKACGSLTHVETLVTGQLPLLDLVASGWIYNAAGRIDCTVTGP